MYGGVSTGFSCTGRCTKFVVGVLYGRVVLCLRRSFVRSSLYLSLRRSFVRKTVRLNFVEIIFRKCESKIYLYVLFVSRIANRKKGYLRKYGCGVRVSLDVLSFSTLLWLGEERCAKPLRT